MGGTGPAGFGGKIRKSVEQVPDRFCRLPQIDADMIEKRQRPLMVLLCLGEIAL